MTTPDGVEPAAVNEVPDSTDENPLAAALDEVRIYVGRYVVVGSAELDAITLWVAHTWVFDAADATPYLHVTSPEKESGKTRLIEVLRLLVREPIVSANMSDAALFRVIDDRKPTVLIDEVDTIFGSRAREREDLRGLLNAGYRRGAPVYRMGGPKMTELQSFQTFCPKLLAGLGSLPETLASRCITIAMRRKARSESAERFRERDARDNSGSLVERLGSLATHADSLRDARPKLPDALSDRAQDVWEPLLAIADLAGGVWPDRARCAAVALSTGEATGDDSLGIQLLADIREVFFAPIWEGIFPDPDRQRIATAGLIEALSADPERPWVDWQGRGRGPLSPRDLAKLLKPYGARPRSIRLPSGETPKGYHRDDFEDAWARYLPERASPGRHTATEHVARRSNASIDPPHEATVPNGGIASSPHGMGHVADVADGCPIPGDSGFLDLLDRARAAGHITDRERRERRLRHFRLRRAGAA